MSTVAIHLDTDLGGDPDDACALAMLLGWPDIEITGITTNLDVHGRRAGMVAELLKRAGRTDIQVAAGAGATITTQREYHPNADNDLYWGGPIAPLRTDKIEALRLLKASIEAGATIVAIGAYTNLAILDELHPDILEDTPVVVMGGWIDPPAEGLPNWGREKDWNVQADARAAQIVAVKADLTLVTLPVTLKAHLCVSHLPRLRAVGPLGELLARQAEAWGEEEGMAALAAAHSGLPDDLLNFQYDPVTCAVAAGWDGATIEEMQVGTRLEGDQLRFSRDDDGRAVKVVVDIDADDFVETWFECLENAQRRAVKT